MKDQHFSFCAVSVIDLVKEDFSSFVIGPDDLATSPYFDLASLTKPFCLSLTALFHPELFKEKKNLWLLNHRAGLPIGGRLSKDNWRDQIQNYSLELTATDTYSDYSALRLMLEIERQTGKSLYSLVSKYWDKEIYHWQSLPSEAYCPKTGFRAGHSIRGVVHDDNAYVLQGELSHAGLFGTIEGVSRSILKWSKESQKFLTLKNDLAELPKERRFVSGFDTVSDPMNTLAGAGCSRLTFGHLGFTGTSFWCDLEKQKAWVLLTNATENYWYQREGLKNLRQTLGKMIWQST